MDSWLKTASRLFKFQKEGFWMPPLERQTFLNKATAKGVDLRAAEQKNVELMNRITMLGILALILF